MLMILRISPRNCSNSCSTFNRSSAPIHLRHRVPLLRESSIKTRDKRVVKAGETFGGFEHFNSVETEIRGEREREATKMENLSHVQLFITTSKSDARFEARANRHRGVPLTRLVN